MVQSVESLKGLFKAKNGVARSNLFQVMLPSLQGISSSELNLLCKDVILPGRQLMTYDKEIGTRREKVAYGEIHDDVSMSFLLLNDYGAKKYFEAWQGLAYDVNNYQIGYKSNYVADISIHQLNKGMAFAIGEKDINLGNIGPINFNLNIDLDLVTADSYVYSCTLLDAWPVAVESIQLNNELDGLVELRVQLSYTKWKSTF